MGRVCSGHWSQEVRRILFNRKITPTELLTSLAYLQRVMGSLTCSEGGRGERNRVRVRSTRKSWEKGREKMKDERKKPKDTHFLLVLFFEKFRTDFSPFILGHDAVCPNMMMMVVCVV